MPIFKYKCSSCGNDFEYLLLSGKDEEIKCSSCGSLNVEKQLTVFSRFKSSRGSGRPEAGCCGDKGSCDNPKRCCES